jgi:hypothetical protein
LRTVQKANDIKQTPAGAEYKDYIEIKGNMFTEAWKKRQNILH